MSLYHMITSVDAKKNKNDKIQTLFPFNKLGIKRDFLHLIKGIYENLRADVLFNGKD